MGLVKRILFQIMGFDSFERKYFLFLIPGSFVVPLFLILPLAFKNKFKKRLALEFIAITIVYSFVFEIGNGILIDIVPGKISGLVHVLVFSFANFLFSVAWMNFYNQLK